MKKCKVLILALALSVGSLCGCGENANADITEETVIEESSEVEQSTDEVQTIGTNAHIDFEALKQQNDEIFAWLQIPGTNVNTPVLKSNESDDFYMNHDANKAPDDKGTAYIEQPVNTDMCDFNTVIHGSKADGAVFEELTNFGNPEFFEKNEEFYVYIEGNVLTYKIFASYERDNTSLIREYSFAEAVGDRAFLQDLYNQKVIGKQIREGWDELNEYNFLVTLTLDDLSSDKQFVVLGVLINDAAGTINRDVVEEINIGPLLLEGN